VAALRGAIAAGSVEAEVGLAEARVAGEDLTASLDAAGDAANRAGGAGRAAGGALRDGASTAREGWEATSEAMERSGEASREMAQGLAQDITGPIREALTSGRLAWETFAGAVAKIAQNLATRLIELAFRPIEEALINALTGMGGGGGGGIGGLIGGLFGIGGFARGGAFARGGQFAAFARGGVVDRPTLFPFARGIGLMGEAGPEAILPLRRGRGGRLGVETAGDAQPPAPEHATRIINVLDPSVVGDYLATPAGERAIVNVIRRNRGIVNA
jgi:lambda family phage tail tape measure protein